MSPSCLAGSSKVKGWPCWRTTRGCLRAMTRVPAAAKSPTGEGSSGRNEIPNFVGYIQQRRSISIFPLLFCSYCAGEGEYHRRSLSSIGRPKLDCLQRHSTLSMAPGLHVPVPVATAFNLTLTWHENHLIVRYPAPGDRDRSHSVVLICAMKSI